MNQTIPVNLTEVENLPVDYRKQTWLPKHDFVNLGLYWVYSEGGQVEDILNDLICGTGTWIAEDFTNNKKLEITENSYINAEPNCDDPKYNHPKYRVSGYVFTIVDLDTDKNWWSTSLPAAPLNLFSALAHYYSRLINAALILPDPILVLDEDDNYWYLIEGERFYPWRYDIDRALSDNNENWDDIIASNPPIGSWLDFNFARDYDYDYCAPPFAIWTKDHIYFSQEHDFGVSLSVVPRNPSTEPLIDHLI